MTVERARQSATDRGSGRTLLSLKFSRSQLGASRAGRHWSKMRVVAPLWNQLAKMLDFYSQFNPSPLSIKQFIDFGQWLSFHFMSDLLSDFRVVRLVIVLFVWYFGINRFFFLILLSSVWNLKFLKPPSYYERRVFCMSTFCNYSKVLFIIKIVAIYWG